MSESSWRESDSYNELEPVSLLFNELPPLEEAKNPSQGSSVGDRRRRKAAVVLVVIWSSTIVLHLVTWGSWFIFGLTALMGFHAVRILLARPLTDAEPLSLDQPEALPFVSVLVAAKNEQAVIGRLVSMLCNLDYPSSRYEIWVVDDNSTDQTPHLLQQLSQQYPHLRVFHRLPEAAGGKSGALNQVIPLTQGEIIAVFDADAQVAPDMLRRVVSLFERPGLGAVQVRKAIANGSTNFLTYGQVAEMALDIYFQQQRIAIGGIGELRGNGQFVRRLALDECGGWNEETITDDLDLTIRLHLAQWDIDCLTFPAVQEEGVTRPIALWHQRNRWAEGGYQRYLDYWRPILRNRMGTGKTIDLFMFWITQYILPTAAIPDFLMAVLRHRPLLYTPIASLTVSLSIIGMMSGLQQIRRQKYAITKENPTTEVAVSDLPLLQTKAGFLGVLLHTLMGTLYMFHWVPIMASTTARMAIRPKRLKWVKTVHEGSEHSAA